MLGPYRQGAIISICSRFQVYFPRVNKVEVITLV